MTRWQQRLGFLGARTDSGGQEKKPMSRTLHHRARGHNWRDPAPYRRAHLKRWKVRCKHLVRVGKYDALPPLRQKFGYYW